MFYLLIVMMLTACSPSAPLAGNDVAAAGQAPSSSAAEMPVDADRSASTSAGEPVANLPFSHGKVFRTLDEYLEHLEHHAKPIDQPWWREIRPGVYEHVKRMPEARREIATREELRKRFGFSR